MTIPDTLQAAEVVQWRWKTPAMQRMAVAICRLAVQSGTREFSAKDLPDFTHGGSGIAGAVFHGLLADGVLAQCGGFIGGKLYPKTVRNAGGNKINLYRLASRARAERQLVLHGQALPEQEMKQELLMV